MFVRTPARPVTQAWRREAAPDGSRGVRVAWLTRRAPLALTSIVLISAVVRAVVSLARTSPLLFPDEFVYSAMARAVVESGLPTILGSFVPFPALLGPYLMAPAWLIHDVRSAYHAELAIGSIAFSLTAVPVYLLARRVGVATPGALLAATLSVLVPDVAYTTVGMTEPLAYPVFVGFALVALETYAAPSWRRQATFLLCAAVLLSLRFQFAFLPYAFLAACVVADRSVRALTRQKLVTSVLAIAAGGLLISGVGRGTGYYGNVVGAHVHVLGPPWWALIGLFVFSIAAGWVVVPGAVIGIAGWLRRGDGRQRLLGAYSLLALAGLLGEAAYFGAFETRIQERYIFYAAPFALIAFAWSLEHLPRTRAYALIAYALGAASIVLPATASMKAASTDQAPTLLGLAFLGGNGAQAMLFASVALAGLAVLVGTRTLPPLGVPAVAVVVLLGVGSAGSVAFLRFGRTLAPRLGTEVSTEGDLGLKGTPTLLASDESNQYEMMKTIFWNRGIRRVADLGDSTVLGRVPAQPVGLLVGGRVRSRAGQTLTGPFVVDRYTAWTNATLEPGQTAGRLERDRVPAVTFFGLAPDSGELQVASRLVAWAGRSPRTVTLDLRPAGRSARLAVACPGSRRTVAVPLHGSRLTIPIPLRTVISCRLSLVQGQVLVRRGVTFGAFVTRLSISDGG